MTRLSGFHHDAERPGVLQPVQIRDARGQLIIKNQQAISCLQTQRAYFSFTLSQIYDHREESR